MVVQDIGGRRLIRILLIALVLVIVALAFYSSLRSSSGLLEKVKGSLRSGQSPQQAAVQQPTGVPPAPDDSNIRLAVRDFYREVRGENEQDVEAIIRGESAVLAEEKLYTIISPVVEAMLKGGDSAMEVAAAPQKVRLTAKGALFDENRATLLLYNLVRVVGEDFDIATDNITYEPRKHAVRSSAAVVMNRYRLGPDAQKVLAMTVTGRGLDVDLTLRKMVIPLESKARLLDVSADFLAAGTPSATTGEAREVVITADGAMTYEHTANRAAFRDNVQVTSGEKRLTCDRLDIALGKSEGADRLQVMRVTARGSVVFNYRDQEGRGQQLVWENVTQAGILTGGPALLTTRELRISGATLTFFRLTDRFQVDGAGTLNWSPPPGQAAVRQENQEKKGEQPREATPVSPVQLVATEPVEATWKGGMLYNAASRSATFQDTVKAAQKDALLTCDVLELEFEPGNERLRQALARGNVSVSQPASSRLQTISCDRALWLTNAGTVQLLGGNGKAVTVVSGDERLVAADVTFHPDGGTFECPAPGRLWISAARMPQGGSVGQPLEVGWQRSMRYCSAPQRYAEFLGAVQAAQPGRMMRAEALRVDFDEKLSPVKITARTSAVVEVRRAEGRTAAPEEKAPTAGPPAPASGRATPAVAVLAGDVMDWQLAADVLTAEPPKDVVYCFGPGQLEALRKDRPNDTIKWKEQMFVDFRESFARFQGGVDAFFSGSTLQCERLRLDFDKERELRHVNAEGQVRFDSGGQQPWKLMAESAEAVFAPSSVLSQVIAKSQVQVQDAERMLRTQLLKLFFEKKAEDALPSLARAAASGQVSVRYAAEEGLEATCDELSWDVVNDKYLLKGKPAQLKKARTSQSGDTIIIDRLSGRWTIPRGERPAETTVEEEQP